MSKDAPLANKTKPLLTPGGPHFTVSLLNPRRSPSDRSVWTLSWAYPQLEAMMRYSPSLITGVLEAPYSYPVPPLSQGWESPNCTSNMCTDGLGSPLN